MKPVAITATVFAGLTCALLGLALPAGAQDFDAPELPPSLATDVLDYFNDPSVLRLEGRATIPAGAVIAQSVGLLRGELVVRGTIQGDVVLLDADLRLEEGARIDGAVLIVGGRLRAGDQGLIAGGLQQYSTTFRYVDAGRTLELAPASLRGDRGIRLFGSRITVRAGSNYNRVEGLPILFGPVIETSGPNPYYLEGLVTLRTETGFTDDGQGFRINLERRYGRPSRYFYGVSAYSEVTPIERWGLGDLESSLTTFVLHRDYRDYFERHGWSVYAGTNLTDVPLRLQLSYRDEKHFSLQVASPWSLKENERPWRPLPLIGEGDVRLLELRAEWDERNDRSDPTDGWFLDTRFTYGLTGELSLPEHGGDEMNTAAVPAVELPTSFTSGFLDFRRYARVDPSSDLRLRTVLSGAMGGHALPPQFQHALGGEGSLPGYGPLSLDCGARAQEVFVTRDGQVDPYPAYQRYGCDRIALFQAQYRHTLPFNLDLFKGGDEYNRSGWTSGIDFEPALALFFNVGRGWSDWDGGSDIDDVADVGLGLEIGSIGAYWAYPLIDGPKKFNFFLRLQRRF